MMFLQTLALALALQQPAAPVATAAAPFPTTPIARLEVVQPHDLTMAAGDTLRLRIRALDADGRPVPNATFRYVAAGGRFEGSVAADGLVHSGSTGTIPVTVIASVPGARAVMERVEVRMIHGPATRVELENPVELQPGAGRHRRRRRFRGYERAATPSPPRSARVSARRW
jgi:hypothetical protein